MKKAMRSAFSVVFFLAMMFWMAPGQSQVHTLQAFAKIRNGQLRLVNNPTECKKSERSVTSNGTFDNEGTLNGEYR